MEPKISLLEIQDAMHKAPIGIILIDIKGNILWHNQTLEQLLDISSEQLTGKTTTQLPKELNGVLTSPPETILLQKDDNQRWLHCHSQPYDDGSHVQFYIDITSEQRLRFERDRLEEDLQQLTTRDPVTGLPNRRALLQALEPLISRSRRYANPLSLIKLHIDLDEVDKKVATTYREEAWLKVGQLLKEQMRWADIIGRFDGADFLLVLPETPEDATHALASKVCESINELELVSTEGKVIKIKPFCGLTSWQKGDDANLMLQRLSNSIADAIEADTPIAATG